MSGSAEDYATLGLPVGTPPEAVKQRYLELVKIYHPDATGNPDSAGQFQAIDDAYARITGKRAQTSSNQSERKSKKGWFKFKRKGDPIVLFRQYVSWLLLRASVAIIAANIVMIVVYIVVTHDVAPFSLLWWLLLPSIPLGKVVGGQLAYDWLIALWMSYIYWAARYRLSQQNTQSSTPGEPDWDRWN